MTEAVTLYVGELDPALKDALAADAEERQASMNDVAVGILARRFGVPFAGSGRKGPGGRGSRVGAYRMPPALYRLIAVEAIGGSKKAIVERTLCDHYGLDYRPAARGRPRAAAAR